MAPVTMDTMVAMSLAMDITVLVAYHKAFLPELDPTDLDTTVDLDFSVVRIHPLDRWRYSIATWSTDPSCHIWATALMVWQFACNICIKICDNNAILQGMATTTMLTIQAWELTTTFPAFQLVQCQHSVIMESVVVRMATTPCKLWGLQFWTGSVLRSLSFTGTGNVTTVWSNLTRNMKNPARSNRCQQKTASGQFMALTKQIRKCAPRLTWTWFVTMTLNVVNVEKECDGIMPLMNVKSTWYCQLPVTKLTKCIDNAILLRM